MHSVRPSTAASKTCRSGRRVGTSSLRRQAQLKALRPDLEIHALRGNVDTRLRKLEAGEYDAIILAAAGLNRLGKQECIRQVLAARCNVSGRRTGCLGDRNSEG